MTNKKILIIIKKGLVVTVLCFCLQSFYKGKKGLGEDPNIDQILLYNTDYNNRSLEDIDKIFKDLIDHNYKIILDYDPFVLKNINFFKNYNITLRTREPLEEELSIFPQFFNIPIESKVLYNDLKDQNTQIYIGDILGFSAEHILKSNRKVITRCNPVMGLTAGVNHSYKDFFIRPEDLHLYEDVIDVCDFSDFINGDILYDIYFKQKRWIGDLSEIINNIPKGLRGDGILPDYGHRRFNCEKRCASRSFSCDICNRYAHLSQKAAEVGLYFKA